MSNPLLSICIPTYNRCEVLNNTLELLFSDSDFDPILVEVIVSDNGSDDLTAEVVAKFPYVKYYRNKENIRDLNFAVTLGYATGSYIRLFNDTISFKPKALGLILQRIRENLGKGQNVFFYENMFLNANSQKEVGSAEEYIKEVSYYTTWIANFGAWREDFFNIENKDRYASLQFTQVDWSYRIVENGKKTKIYFDNLIEVVTPNKKGGYNVFDVFVNKYLFIVKKEKISFLSYEREKYRLCHYFVYPWLIKLFITDGSAFSFDVKGAFKIIFLKYWYEPYLYIMLCLFLLRKFQNEKNIR